MILKSSQKVHKKISTHLLTVLIISVILHVEQRKGIKRERSIEIPGKVPKEVFNSNVYKESNGGMTYVNA